MYGRPNLTKDGGAAEAMTTKEPIPIYRRKEKPLQRDFIALNRGAVTSGLVTAKVLNCFPIIQCVDAVFCLLSLTSVVDIFR